MPDLFDLFIRWRKQILSLVIITLILTALIVLLLPKQYQAVATALPAAGYATDKTGVFGQNLQELYSALGSPDDLDRILGTAHLDTVYVAVAMESDLANYYHIKQGPASVQRAARLLKKRTDVIKSDYGELKVKTRDRDRNRAADLANAIMKKLRQIYQDVQAINNQLMLSKITKEYAEKKLRYQTLLDSLNQANNGALKDLLTIQKTSMLQQIAEYEKLLDQYKLMVDARPEALIVIEPANPPLKPDRPKPVETIVAAAVLSLFFGLLAALIAERRRMAKK